MCVQEEGRVTGDPQEVLHLQQKVTHNPEMSIMSKCLECFRMGRGNRMEESCLDLALEGERLCKAGDYGGGVSFFESALLVGTEDLQILSAIYSQLGNAYFHLQEYNRALEYHRHDLTLTRTIGDEVGEAKASGNLGNTLKVLGRYNEAAVCCQRHLDISRAICDKVGQARALYNFGNVYHAKAKGICWSGVEPGDFPDEARTALRKAAQYYEANLILVKELGDPAAQGRTLGNLGNTFYLLGEFEKSVSAHEKRLLLAKEFGDKSAERRAHCNLGNAHIFLRQFNDAAAHYKRTLQLARLLRDPAVEAQACYSLGNTYTLLQDYQRAIEYHLKHLLIAQELHDRVGEGRAYWSLGNAHTALGNHQEALDYAEKHLEIAKETGDRSGEVTARMNLSDLRLVVSLKANSPHSFFRSANTNANSSGHGCAEQGSPQLAGVKSVSRKTESGEKLEKSPEEVQRGDPPTHQFSQDWEEDVFPGSSKSNTMKASTKLFLFHGLRSRKHKSSRTSSPREQQEADRTETPVQDQQDLQAGSRDTIGDESFFDLLSRFQGNRMDDQRCSVDSPHPAPPGHASPGPSSPSSPSPPLPVAESRWPSASDPSGPFQDPGRFLELLASCQARRLDDQRVSLSHFPGLRLSTSDPPPTPSTCSPNPLPLHDCPVSPSRAAAPETPAEPLEGDEVFFDLLARCQGSRLNEQRCAAPLISRGPTVPDEDFFSLILRSQSNRMEEQRVPPPSPHPVTTRSRPE